MQGNVLIVGDVMLDRFLWGEVRDTVSQEAPCLVVDISDRRPDFRLGGAGLVAHCVHILGGDPVLVGMIGIDEAGDTIQGLMTEIGCPLDGVIRVLKRPTTTKTRIACGRTRQQIVRLDWEHTDAIAGRTALELLEQTKGPLYLTDVVVVSDYAKGVITPEVAQAVIAAAKKRGKPVIVDPKGADWEKYRGAYLVKANRKEIQDTTAGALTDASEIGAAAIRACECFDIDHVLVTLAETGIVHAHQGRYTLAEPRTVVENPSILGAGDFCAACVALLVAQGEQMNQAVAHTTDLASVYVSKHHALSHKDSSDFKLNW